MQKRPLVNGNVINTNRPDFVSKPRWEGIMRYCWKRSKDGDWAEVYNYTKNNTMGWN